MESTSCCRSPTRLAGTGPIHGRRSGVIIWRNCCRNRSADLLSGDWSVGKRRDDPEVRIAMLLVGTEAHSIIHAMEVSIGGAGNHLLRQVMRVRRGEYNHGPCGGKFAGQFHSVAIRRAGQFTQLRIWPRV